jgi:hypothetical protein
MYPGPEREEREPGALINVGPLPYSENHIIYI